MGKKEIEIIRYCTLVPTSSSFVLSTAKEFGRLAPAYSSAGPRTSGRSCSSSLNPLDLFVVRVVDKTCTVSDQVVQAE